MILVMPLFQYKSVPTEFSLIKFQIIEKDFFKMDLKKLAKLAKEDPAKFGVLVKPMRIHFSLSSQSLGNEAQGNRYSHDNQEGKKMQGNIYSNDRDNQEGIRCKVIYILTIGIIKRE
jgi:hypothetical protein